MENNELIKNREAQQAFPMELLNQSVEAKLDYFRNLKITHPILTQVFEELWESTNYYNEGSLILLFGPTGVGKTTIMELLEKRILEEMKNELLNDKERIPLVKAEIAGPTSGKFDWKDFYKEILRGLAEFSIDHRVDLSKWENPHQPWLPLDNLRQSYSAVANDNRSTESRLRTSVEQALKHRRPKVVLLDEAQHLTALSTGRKLLDQQNVIKSLANRTEITHALFGSYELMTFRNLNGQLARRTVNIHFPRYLHTSKRDFRDFEKTVWNFQKQLPLEKEPDLMSQTEQLYEGSLGCIGILKNWLYRALVAALSAKSETLTGYHLEQSRLDDVKLVKILKECLNGETRLVNDRNEAQDELKKLLYTASPSSAPQRDVKFKSKKNPEKGFQPVGQRRPWRDEVGKRKAV
jgi:ABC-type nitrate/sulfonate/bicarbonate transport system ATPase subunit